MFNIVYNSINHYKYIKGDNYKADWYNVGVYLMTLFRCQLCVPAIIGIAVDTGSEGMTVT